VSRDVKRCMAESHDVTPDTVDKRPVVKSSRISA
jgi:hypothetical protein